MSVSRREPKNIRSLLNRIEKRLNSYLPQGSKAHQHGAGRPTSHAS